MTIHIDNKNDSLSNNQVIINSMTQKLVNNIVKKLEEKFGEVMVFEDNGENDNFVDDGSVHIRRNGVRFVIDFDQFKFGDSLAEKKLLSVSKFIDNLIK